MARYPSPPFAFKNLQICKFQKDCGKRLFRKLIVDALSRERIGRGPHGCPAVLARHPQNLELRQAGADSMQACVEILWQKLQLSTRSVFLTYVKDAHVIKLGSLKSLQLSGHRRVQIWPCRFCQMRYISKVQASILFFWQRETGHRPLTPPFAA